MSEKYGKYGVKYYAVAVVKKSNQGLNHNSLKGKKSCHTAARRTAGWRVPIGYMLRKEIMPAVACGNDINDFLSVAEFFKESCVPGKEQNKFSRKRLNLWTDQAISTFKPIPPCSVVFQGQYYIFINSWLARGRLSGYSQEQPSLTQKNLGLVRLDCPTKQPRTQLNWDTRVSCVNGAQRETREKVAWKRSCEAFFLMLYSDATTTFMVWFFAHIQEICLKKWTKTLPL